MSDYTSALGSEDRLSGPSCDTDLPGGPAWALKRGVEWSLALLLTFMILPLLLLIALAVKIDSPGPVLFRQPRFGRGGRPFDCLKFRTMYAEMGDRSGGEQTGDDDPRITRVGMILRRSSLDELPQFLNVLMGQMALVGPRAHPCGMRVQGQLCEDIDRRYHERHAVPPGVTGLAQVMGSRGAVKDRAMLARRVSYDIRYIRDWSLVQDAWIVARTFGTVLSGRGAR